jgi:TrmH family RNA methyltransferase
MQSLLITSLSNPTIKQARALRQHKRRLEAGLFLVEGLHHIGEAMDAGWEIEMLFYAPDLLISEFGNQLVERAAASDVRLYPVSAQVMQSLSEKENPQGMIAVARQRNGYFEAIQNKSGLVALVSPQDPGNVGTILRTIDATGGGGLCLLDSSLDLYHPSLVRASMGTIFWKPVVQAPFSEFLEWARSDGIQLIGTSARAQVDYRTFTPRPVWALVMGSEQKGLSPQQLAVCDVSIALPMRGRASSLNLAVATGILLYSLGK